MDRIASNSRASVRITPFLEHKPKLTSGHFAFWIEESMCFVWMQVGKKMEMGDMSVFGYITVR